MTNATPAEKILCYVPHTRIGKVNPMKLRVKEKIPQFRRQTVEEIKRCQKKVVFHEEENVLYRNHFKEIFRWIPATKLKRISAVTFLINLKGNVRLVHVNQLKKSIKPQIIHVPDK